MNDTSDYFFHNGEKIYCTVIDGKRIATDPSHQFLQIAMIPKDTMMPIWVYKRRYKSKACIPIWQCLAELGCTQHYKMIAIDEIYEWQCGEFSIRTIQRALRELEEQDVLYRETRFADGKQRPNAYFLPYSDPRKANDPKVTFLQEKTLQKVS